jgi:hypothetical protein
VAPLGGGVQAHDNERLQHVLGRQLVGLSRNGYGDNIAAERSKKEMKIE